MCACTEGRGEAFDSPTVVGNRCSVVKKCPQSAIVIYIRKVSRWTGCDASLL